MSKTRNSSNQLGRRNINDFNRAELVLQAEPLIAAKAKERQESGINQYSPVANLPQAETGETRDELSAMSGVSARKVLDQGSEELIQKVDYGEIAVSTAAKIAELLECYFLKSLIICFITMKIIPIVIMHRISANRAFVATKKVQRLKNSSHGHSKKLIATIS